MALVDVHALRDGDGRARAEILPDVGHRLQQVAARGAEIDFRLREVGLDHGIVPQRLPGAARHLGAHRLDEIVERGPGDAAGDAGKADLVAGMVTHAVERAALAAFAVELARDRMVGAHEEIVERELVAGGAAQADGAPDIGPLHVLRADQHGALERGAVGVVFGRTVGRKDRAVGAEPGRMAAAGGKGPDAGHPVAALAFDRTNPGAWPPRQHRARIAKNRLRHRQVEIGRRHRTSAGLAEAPGGGGIRLGDGLDDVEKGEGVGFDPVGRARQQQAKQLRVVQSVEKGGGQPPRGLDLAGSACNARENGLGPGDHRPVAGKIGRICDRNTRDHARGPPRPCAVC